MKLEKIHEDELKEHYVVLNKAIRRINEFGYVEIELWNGEIKKITSEETLKQMCCF